MTTHGPIDGRPVRVGMVSVAHVHAPAYLDVLSAMPNVEVVGVWDEDAKLAEAVARPVGVAPVGSLDTLLANDVDAVVISGINRDHWPLVERAAANGLHILCEQPLATTVTHAQSIVAACEAARVRLMTAHAARYTGVFGAVAAMVRDGAVGEVVCLGGANPGELPNIHSTWYVDPELAGGGAMSDHVVHLVDLYRCLLHSEVVEVYAVANRILHDRFNSVETGGLLSLRFANGVFATIDCSFSKPRAYPAWGDLTFEVLGTNGVLDADLFRHHLTVFGSREEGTSWPVFGLDANRAMLSEFISAVSEDREPAITGLDGLRTVEVVDAAYRSVAAGQPVAISYPAETDPN